MIVYPFPPIQEHLNGKEVSILGVGHTHNFFLEHKSYLESFVVQQDVLVLEQPPGYDFWESIFFGPLSEIARERGQKVYQADPLTIGNHNLDILTGVMGHLLMAIGIANLLGPLLRRNMGEGEKMFSRRYFLKYALQMTAGTSLSCGNVYGQGTISILFPKSLERHGIEETCTYGNTDYRNIVIAEGLERICHNVSEIKKIGVIHGAAHTMPIHTYLTIPSLRWRKLLYLPHNFLGNTQVREYSPIETGWKLNRTF